MYISYFCNDICKGHGLLGHGDRYIGSLFMVDEPVPDDLEPTNNHNQKVISVIIKKK